MADTFTVVFDACVLYPFVLRDLLVELATTDLFRARWTERIHDEWIKAVCAQHPEIRPASLQRTRELMNMHVLDCVVEGYEDLIDGLTLPDPDDRHVLGAAIRCGAQVIVTQNLKDYPPANTAKYGIEAQHPDDFVSYLVDLSPGAVCASVKRCRARLRSPAFTVEEYLLCLQRHELIQTASALRAYAEVL